MSETEQNKTEEPTPFKLKRGREKGMVARGADLGFFAALAAFSLFAVAAGEPVLRRLLGSVRSALVMGMDAAAEPRAAFASALTGYVPALQDVAFLCTALLVVIVFVEIVQVGGIVFSAHPLKPDFKRLNPAQGLKRLFSLRMLKEAAKNVLKLLAYGLVAYLVIDKSFDVLAPASFDAVTVISALRENGLQLLFSFALVALVFAGIDQVIVRAEFRKQMRMSRSELTREHKEREGEPRQKQKRKQLHAEFAKQTRATTDLAGSDMLIVNPQHYAVALSYDATHMGAPTIKSKGRNRFALLMKARATALSIPTFENPPLARALYRRGAAGHEIAPENYNAVADLYLRLARLKTGEEAPINA